MSSIALPPAFPVTGVGIVSLLCLTVFQFMKVSGARKEAKVPYPNLYASDAEARADPKKMKFNCVQRAHANTLENLPAVLSCFAYLSVFHPLFATGSFTLWVFGRIFYTTGYATGSPAARNGGLARLSYLGLSGLFFGTIYVSVIKTYQYLV